MLGTEGPQCITWGEASSQILALPQTSELSDSRFPGMLISKHPSGQHFLLFVWVCFVWFFETGSIAQAQTHRNPPASASQAQEDRSAPPCLAVELWSSGV